MMTKSSRNCSRTARKAKNVKTGYGRPPEQYQFKPGQSGNPRGRPKITPDFPELIAKELKRPQKVIIRGKEVSMRTDALLARRVISMALKGEKSAIKIVCESGLPALAKSRKSPPTRIHKQMTAKEAAAAFAETMAHDYSDE